MTIDKITKFFPTVELYAFFDETLRFQASGGTADMRSYPHLTMLWIHCQFGVPRSQMTVIPSGEVLLTPDAVKAMARKRLQGGDLSPEEQDAVIDLINLARQVDRSGERES